MGILHPLRRLLYGRCPFHASCPYYRKDAYTCNQGARLKLRYCGKDREFMEGA